MIIKYVYEGNIWPAVKVQDLGSGLVELKFFPSAATGLPDVGAVPEAAYDAGKAEGTWHNEGD